MGSCQSNAMDGARADHVPASTHWMARMIRLTRVAAIAIFTNLLLAILLTMASSLGHHGKVVAGEDGRDGAASLAEQPVTLTADGRTWTPLLGDLGITYHARASGDAETPPGGDADVENDEYQGGTLGGARTVIGPMSVRFDSDRFDAHLDRIEDELDGRPVDASVTVDGTDVVVAPGRDGWAIDRVAVKMTLLVQIVGREPVVVALPLRRQPAAITTEHAEALKAAIDRALALPFILKVDDQQWTVAPERLADAVRVERNGEGRLTATLDSRSTDALVAEIAADINTGPTDAWVQDLGTHQWLVPSRRGRTLHREALIQSFESAIANGEHVIEPAVTEDGSPKVTTEKLMTEMGITDLIATGDSEFAGSGGGRAHNIALAAYMIDGTLIPSGGMFSFNDAVGSLFSGEFTEAGSYIDGPSGQSLAGGVCQVSTTVFRAALEAGLPIVEWWPHSYRSPFYESGGWSPGFDASIVQDGGDPAQSADFRFENTTDAWLLVRASASDDGRLRVELHGADPGYRVEFEEPVVEVIEEAPASVDVVVDDALPPGTVLPLQPAMNGLRVTVVRRVFDADGEEISTNSFVSSYRAYAAIRRVSPDME